jgi:hypothetical protein
MLCISTKYGHHHHVFPKLMMKTAALLSMNEVPTYTLVMLLLLYVCSAG